MNRQEILRRLRDVGIDLRPYRLDYLISTGQIPRPPINRSRKRVFTKDHLSAILAIEQLYAKGAQTAKRG